MFVSLMDDVWMTYFLYVSRKVHIISIYNYYCYITYFIFDIRFSRLIAPVNPADDFNLSTPLFQLYGTSNTGGTLKIFTSK